MEVVDAKPVSSSAFRSLRARVKAVLVRRRRIQFRLRTLLVVLTVFAVLFALVSMQWRRHAAEMKLLRALRVTVSSSSGLIHLERTESEGADQEEDTLQSSGYAFLAVPRWLARVPAIRSDGFFSRVRTLHLGPRARIAQLSLDERQALTLFTALESLIIEGRILTRADLDLLSKYPDLWQLSLAGCTFEPHAVESLGGLRSLRRLDLDGSNVTDDDLRSLGNLAGLDTLDLSHTEVTDEGLAHLGSLRKLGQLHLSGSRVTDEGVDRLRQALPQLQLLDD